MPNLLFILNHMLAMRNCLKLIFCYVDVDDVWNLVGCLDTHLKRIVFILCYFIIHVVVLCFKTL
ncbi:hypothetical protein Hanom_Chr15g01363551 [Helianthus anomalus]